MNHNNNPNNIENDLLNNLSNDYDIGKISIKDLYLLLKEKFENDYKIIIENNFFYTSSIEVIIELIQSGNIVAILILTIMTIILLILILLFLKSSFSSSTSLLSKKKKQNDEKEEEEEIIVLRDYTIEQLREYDGKTNPKIFIALKGDVYNVTNASNLYGPEGSYNCFAGRDASRAMAKLSFEEQELNNPRIDDLGPFDRDALEQWVEKFKYIKQYPIVGKLVYPKRDRLFTVSELKQYKGIPPVDNSSNENDSEILSDTTNSKKLSPQNDRIDLEILLAVKGNVYDVSFGGKEHYGPGGSYHIFAGIDASRALAKMSFDPSDVNSSDLSDLTEEQLKILDDWEDKFQNKRLYPIVGKLVSEQNKETLNSTTPITTLENNTASSPSSPSKTTTTTKPKQ